MMLGEALKYAQEHYKEGMWIMPHPNSYFKEPTVIKGRFEISDHYYGICHQSMNPIYTKEYGFAEIVERPEHSKIYGF